MKLTTLLLLAALGLSMFYNQKQYRDFSRLQKEDEKEKIQVRKLEDDLVLARNQNQTSIEEEKQSIQALNDELQKKSILLGNLNSQLRGTNTVETGGNNLSILDWDIKHQKEQITDLDRQLRDLKAQEAQVSDQNQANQSADRWSKAKSESELQAQITYQEQNLRYIQNQYDQARASRSDAEVVSKLKVQVAQQRDFINQLKTQKINLDRQWTQVSASHNLSQVSASLKQDERDLNDRLNRERAALARLQDDHKDQASLANQYKGRVSKINSDIAATRSDIAGLQSELQEHNRKLKALMGSK